MHIIKYNEKYVRLCMTVSEREQLGTRAWMNLKRPAVLFVTFLHWLELCAIQYSMQKHHVSGKMIIVATAPLTSMI